MVTGATSENGVAIANNILSRLAIDGVTPTVTFIDSDGNETPTFDDSQRVTASVSIPYGANNPILPNHFANITIDSEITLWTSRN